MAMMAGFHPWGQQQRWITHYSSSHHILLVGEGDFSFSLCLAMAFSSATNIVATSLDTYDELLKKYPDASANLDMLEILGASLLHGVDATKMSDLYYLRGKKFHRIIFNFPHAGFHGREDNPGLIKMHRDLVRGFLMNASEMLWPNGEIHVNHKITAPFSAWKIEDLASECSLLFIGINTFRIRDYPGYENKRGSGLRPNDSFRLGECSTFKFKLCPEKILQLWRNPVSVPSVPQNFQVPQLNPVMHNNTHSNECQRIFGRYLNHVEETFGSTNYDVARSVRDALRLGFETYVGTEPRGRPLNGFIDILVELLHLSNLRRQRLREMILQHC